MQCRLRNLVNIVGMEFSYPKPPHIVRMEFRLLDKLENIVGMEFRLLVNLLAALDEVGDG